MSFLALGVYFLFVVVFLFLVAVIGMLPEAERERRDTMGWLLVAFCSSAVAALIVLVEFQ
jgi:predicted CDP-diglyceride synthetase/phosphatidate cytidylyltransferase